jgi:hypothetical protein
MLITTGLPQHEAQIPLARAQAEVWRGLAVALYADESDAQLVRDGFSEHELK